jgi:hypothetical protein
MGTRMFVLLLTVGMTVGQGDKTYTRTERHLKIPIVVQPDKRGEIRELLLWVSSDQGKSWNMAGLAQPDAAAFPFHAPSDGQYWFRVQAVYNTGAREPADIYTASMDTMKVIIDSQRQMLRIISAERVGDEVQVVWETTGAQPDLMTLKLEYRVADLGPNAPWQPVPLDPSANGQKRFKPSGAGALAIRMQVNDQVGTPAVVVKELPAAVVGAATFTPVASSNPITAAPATAAIQQSHSLSVSPARDASANTLPAPVLPQDVPAPAPAQVPQMPPPAPAVAPPPAPPPAAPVDQNLQSSPGALTPLPSAKPGDSVNIGSAPSPMGNVPPTLASGPTPPTRPEGPKVQHVRDAQVALEFELDRTGPSGVKKIEVYITQDDGRTWRRWMETADVKSPLQLPLPPSPYEGTFGFKLVPYSGVLQSVGAPQPGDEPDIRLHVDRTAPKVELYPLEPDATQVNAVTLRYLATDANLLPDGVALFWAPHAGGPWQPIHTSNVRPVTGYAGVQECTWMLPPDLPNKVHLKVAARDQAGNVGERVTRDPVTVDLHKPTARVKGIITAKPPQQPALAPPSPFGVPQP